MTDTGTLDGIIVINLDRRPDRWVAFQEDWREILPWDRVIRLSATDGQAIPGFGQRPWFRGRKRDRTWAGRAGCVLSHARAMREAQARGWARVLVLEDDAIPASEGGLPVVLGQDRWDMLYLGASKPQNAGQSPLPGVVTIHGALDTHAYAVNASLRDWLAQSLPDEGSVWNWVAREGAVDRWMRREIGQQFRVVLCRPNYAGQRVGPSDISQHVQDTYGSGDDTALGRSNWLVRNSERARNAAQWTRRRAAGF